MLRQSLRVFVLLVLIIAVVDISYAAPMSAENNVSGDKEGNYVDKRVLVGLVIGILLFVASIAALCIAGIPFLRRYLCCAEGPAPRGVEGEYDDDKEKAAAAGTTVSMSVCDIVPATALSSITGNPSSPYIQVAAPAPLVAISSIVDCQIKGA